MWLGKRLFDFVVALCGLVILSPIFFLVSLWIKFDSRGPVFYRQWRVGKDEVPFQIHKFRSMSMDADRQGLSLTVGDDPRITRSGRFIRKYKIDELAQLLDVLNGNMSLVGPRPEVPKYVEFYPIEIRRRLFHIRPGITDWASVLYKDENRILAGVADPEQIYISDILPQKLEFALKYLEHPSLFVDLEIILKTIIAVFRK